MGSSPESDFASSSHSEDQRRSCTCNICGARLSRPAHLQRHLQRHSANTSKSYYCSPCNRSFSRKDVFQRHERSVHDPGRNSRTGSRAKSCQRCIRQKLKCSREVPCSTCRNDPDQCIYGTGPAAPERGSTTAGTDYSLIDGNLGSLDDLAEAANVYGDLMPVHKEMTGSTTDMQSDTTMSASMEASYEGSNRDSIFARSPMQSQDGILQHSFPEDVPMHHESVSMQNGNHSLNHSDVDVVMDPCLFPFPLDPFALDLYGWDTLLGGDTEPEGPSPCNIQSLSGGDQNQADMAPNVTQGAAEAENVSSSLGNYDNEDDNNAPAASFSDSNQKETENSQNWPGVLDRGGNETWPFDYTSNKGFRRIELPPLKQILEQTVASRPTIQKTILGDLINVLSVPQIPSLNDTPALEAMPAVAFLGKFTRLYFSEFHDVFPIIHVPTWRIEKCATPLLAAMACLGATYSTAEGSTEVSALFAEITQRALFWTGQQDSSAFRSTAYIMASCLHQIYALGTGNRRLYEIADASRGLLVTSLRGLGLLSSESSINSSPDPLGLDVQKLKSMSSDELEETWIAWKDKEAAKRMAWTVFEFDCTVSTMTSKKAAFRIAELPSRLPCSENVWEAHSARAWAALVPFATSSPAGLPFYPTLREIIAHGKTTYPAPAWALRLCGVAIGSVLYDLKEVQDVSAPGVLGMQSMTQAYQETRQSLLSGLSSLEASLGKPTCTADVVNMNVLSLICHRSHLINSGDETMNLIITIFRNSGLDAAKHSRPPSEAARDRLRHIFRNNPSDTRRLAFHAAVIAAIARDSTISTPCETLSVFTGYAFLVAYVRFAPFTDYDTTMQDATAAVRLDGIQWLRDAETSVRINRWIQFGGPVSFGDIDNLCDRRSFEKAKQAALDALSSLSAWGLARKFCQTIGRFA